MTTVTIKSSKKKPSTKLVVGDFFLHVGGCVYIMTSVLDRYVLINLQGGNIWTAPTIRILDAFAGQSRDFTLVISAAITTTP